MTQTIEQLTARVRELEEENARLKAECDDIKQVQFPRKLEAVAVGWKKQLAASQAYAEQLREVIEEFVEVCTPQFCACEPDVGYKCRACNPIEAVKAARELLAVPRDTSALDAYVSEKVKEIIESHAPEGRNVTNAQHVEMRQKFFDQIATLTHQRDLAVEALERQLADAKHCQQVMCNEVGIGFLDVVTLSNSESVLSAIKESEAK